MININLNQAQNYQDNNLKFIIGKMVLDIFEFENRALNVDNLNTIQAIVDSAANDASRLGIDPSVIFGIAKKIEIKVISHEIWTRLDGPASTILAAGCVL